MKRSVKSIPRFYGWPLLEKLVEKAEGPRDKGLVATLFETGGRCSEVLQLTKNHFTLDTIDNKPYVVVNAMPVVKKFHKEKQPDGSRIVVKDPTYRSISFPANEPLVKPMLTHIRAMSPGKKLFPLTRVMVWMIVTKISKDVWVHWFRSQRACQLATEYDFDVMQLMEFFAWSDIKTALRYARLGHRSLGAKMKR